MAAGRGPDHADAIGVEPVLRRIGPDPSDRRLDVVDLGRPGRLAAQPVVDRGRGIIAAFHQVGDLAQPHRLVARPERPAVDVHDHRQRLAAGGALRQEQVERLARVARAGVRDVLLDPDTLRQPRRGVALRLLGEASGRPREQQGRHQPSRRSAHGARPPLQGRGKVLADVRMCLILSRGRAVRQRGKPEMSRDSADVDPGAGTFVASPRGIDLSDHRGG